MLVPAVLRTVEVRREGRGILRSIVATVRNNTNATLLIRKSAVTPVLNGETNNPIFKRTLRADEGSHFRQSALVDHRAIIRQRSVHMGARGGDGTG